MMRKSVKAIMKNGPRFWAVAASSLSPSSRMGAFDPVSLSGAGNVHPRGRAGPEKPMVPDLHHTSRALEDGSHCLASEGQLREHFGITGRKDRRCWVGSFMGSPVAKNHGACDYLPSKGRPVNQWRNLDQSSLLEPTKRNILRTFSTNIKVDEKRSQEKESQPEVEGVPSQPKTIDDFQHEEIVGPTVERDLSDTANEVRESIDELATFMSKLSTGFVALASVQLLAVVWTSFFHQVGPIMGVMQGLAFVLSFALAYLLRHFRSAIEFFAMMEGRSRLRVLTLSLQAIKAIGLLVFRAEFVLRVVVGGSLLALLVDLLHFYSGVK